MKRYTRFDCLAHRVGSQIWRPLLHYDGSIAGQRGRGKGGGGGRQAGPAAVLGGPLNSFDNHVDIMPAKILGSVDMMEVPNI